MLRKERKNRLQLFSPATTQKHIDIHVDAIRFKTIFQFHDDDDKSMKEIIDGFEMGEVTINNPLVISGLQAVFYIKNLDDIKVNLIATTDINEDMKDIKINKGYLLAKCAVESILKKLFEAGCTNKDVVSFQSRQGHPHEHYKVIPYVPLPIILNPSINKEKISLSFEDDDTISHSYAYLSEKRICIFFNPLTKNQKKEINHVLCSLFTKQNHLLSIESSPQPVKQQPSQKRRT